MKKRFTFIDALIILFILAAAAAVVMKSGVINTSKKNAEITFDVLVAECEDNVIDSISEGDVVSISNKEKDTGVVKSFRLEDSLAMTYNSEKGEYYLKALDRKKDIYITIQADVNISENLIQVGTTPVKVGTAMPVRGKGYALSGYIVRINDQ